MKKKVLLLFLSIFLGYYSNAHAACHSFFADVETKVGEESDFSVFVANSEHPRIQEIVSEVLSLQSALLVNKLPLPIEKSRLEKGFLVTEFNTEDMERFLRHEKGQILVACAGEKFAGYLLLGPLSHLEAMYRDFDFGELHLKIDASNYRKFLEFPNHHFIYQIGVSNDLRRTGVGSLLLDSCKKLSSGLIADILGAPEPFVNHASYTFFTKKQGFREVGVIRVKRSAHFRPYETRIMMWHESY